MMHIYPQTDHHSAVGIVGNRLALTLLMHAIGDVLHDPERFRADVKLMPKDGEEYDIYIRCLSDEEMEKRKLPYREFWPPRTETEETE